MVASRSVGRRGPLVAGHKKAAAGEARDGRKSSPVDLIAHAFTCPETSLVISNMQTDFLPPKTAFSASSALIWVLTFLSCSPFFLM